MKAEAYAQRKNKKVENFCTRFSQYPFHVANAQKKWTMCQVTSFCARNPERGSDNSIWNIAVIHQLRPFNDDVTVYNVADFMWLQSMEYVMLYPTINIFLLSH